MKPACCHHHVSYRLGKLLSVFVARPWLFAALTILAAGCCFNTLPPSGLLLEQPSFRETSQPQPRGVVVVVHGLNQRPTSMDTLCGFLRELGFHTYRITLTGHSQLPGRYFSSEPWIQDLRTALNDVEGRFPNLPVHVIGYSLGGLVSVRVIDTSYTVRPASLILIAPALSLRSIVQSARLLRLFPSTTISIRNLAPRDYKLFNQTPLFWYENVISIYDETRLIGDSSPLRSTPTLVIANPRDELISFSGLQDWISDNHLEPGWNLLRLEPRPLTPFLPGHLMIDERSVGVAEWSQLKRLVQEFLIRPNPSCSRSSKLSSSVLPR